MATCVYVYNKYLAGRCRRVSGTPGTQIFRLVLDEIPSTQHNSDEEELEWVADWTFLRAAILKGLLITSNDCMRAKDRLFGTAHEFLAVNRPWTDHPFGITHLHHGQNLLV